MLDDNDWDYAICCHGIYKGYLGGYCKDCDKEEADHGGIEKCLNCGGYKWADQLNEDQTCIRPCHNLAEY